MKYNNSRRPSQCIQTQSTCYQRTNRMTIRGVLWHCTGVDNPWLKRYIQPSDNDSNRQQWLQLLGVNTSKNDWNHTKQSAGLNCWIGKLADGSVTTVQTMPWDYKPWGCGGDCNNGWIQFELCEDNRRDANYFNAVYQEGCEITAYLCAMFELNPQGYVQFNGKQVPVILCHQDSYRYRLGSNHSDVYNWFNRFGKTMTDVRNDVSAMLQSNPSISIHGVAGNIPTSGFISGSVYVPRLTRPEAGNKYYITQGRGGYSAAIQGRPTDPYCNVLSNCVGYAYGRFNEIGGYGECRYLRPTNAENFIESAGSLAVGQDPRLGACMVWRKGPTLNGVDGAGHVAIVEQIISNDEIVTSESGWEGPTFWTQHRKRGNGNWGLGSSYVFRGFIYNPAVSDDMLSSSGIQQVSYTTRKLAFADLGIDESKVAPYILTVDPGYDPAENLLDYGKLKELKVSGLMLYAGQKYEESSHLSRNIFRGAYLKKQVEECHSHNLPFALWTKVLARNLQEAKEETTQLYLTVSRYPPGLGVWLDLSFPVNQSNTLNNQIVSFYYSQLCDWGLSQGAGLYVTSLQLESIDWTSFQDKFQLWLKEMCDDETEMTGIADAVEPSFFKLKQGGES